MISVTTDRRQRGAHIARWRDQVKADHRRGTIDFTVAYQLSERTNEAEFARSGTLLTWQGLALLAAEVGVCERTVQRSVRRLQKFKHLAIKLGGGRHHSNRYTLLLHKTQPAAAIDDNTETVTAVSGFSENGDSGVRVSPETVTPVSGKGDSRVAKPGQPCHPNFLRTADRTSSPTADTDAGAPRQRAVALGAPPEAKRPGNGAAEPPQPVRPHADIEATIRGVLAERAKLFAGARVMEADSRSIQIDCTTDHHARELRPFADDIAAATGVAQVRFTVALGPGLPKRGPP